MSAIVLALNAGSSTLKYAAYRCDPHRETTGQAELLSATEKLAPGTQRQVLTAVISRLERELGARPVAVGHRLVHGGATFTEPTEVDDAVLAQLRELTHLAPLHLPAALDLLEAALEKFADAKHVACFDTAFHSSLPEVARRFALPMEFCERGIRRYGFHGLSYEFVVDELRPNLPRRLVVAHLGSGASMAAILEGSCVDTTMGLTPTGGIPMGTRPGDLDPGLIVHLLRSGVETADQLEHLLNRDCGLRALGGTSDMRELLERRSAGDGAATFAIDSFCYAIKKQIGAYAAALGGLDALVFTGGIGEHVPLVRRLATRGLAVLGIELDDALNDASAPRISKPLSTCAVHVVRTDEDLVIARSAKKLVPGLGL